MHTRTALGILAGLFVWSAMPASAKADTYTNISFPGFAPGETLGGRIYVPDVLDEEPAAIIMMHGCTGMWSESDPAEGVAQNHIEKWGMEMAAQGYVVLAVDSYTPRTPAGLEDPLDYQQQCSGDTWGGHVNPYVARVNDIEAARLYLVSEYGANADGGIGLIGWSQGAQAVLVAMAATPKDSNVAYSTERPYAAAAAFYPGCSTLLGFGMKLTGSNGYWRPGNPIRLHMGEADGLYAQCERRVNNAWSVYATTPGTANELIWRKYTGVGHSFDHEGDDSFPTAKCSEAELADTALAPMCAMRDADIDSLDFLLSRVLAG